MPEEMKLDITKSNLESQDDVTKGDSYVKDGDYLNAVSSYEKAGAKEKIIGCGDLFRKKGEYFNAIWAYKIAGAKEKLISFSKDCLNDGLFEVGFRASSEAESLK